jgi:hypothetical protein
MKENNELCLYVSYYLSRFNLEAYRNLGFDTMVESHTKIGSILNVNPHTVKNMRDEFDPLHGFRAGWYQSPLSKSRERIVEALQYLSEFEIRSIVLKILDNNESIKSNEITNLLSIVEDDTNSSKSLRQFVPRNLTGKKAEEYFIVHHREFGLPKKGELSDTRDLGTGFDFVIVNEGEETYVEVKGLQEKDGGILLTSKEWEMAKKHQDKYFIVIISNISLNPKIRFIKNPYTALRAKENIVRTLQVNWTISKNEIEKFHDDF